MSGSLIDFGFEKSNKILIEAVKSHEQSQKFIERMVKISIWNILYQRVEMPEELFVPRKFDEELHYFIVNKTYSTAPMVQMFHEWMKGFLTVFRQKNLRQLNLHFYHEEKQEIMESFKIKFQYDFEVNKEKYDENLENPLKKLLKSLDTLGNVPKLEGENLTFHLELFLIKAAPVANFKPKKTRESLNNEWKMSPFNKLTIPINRRCSTGRHYISSSFTKQYNASQCLTDNKLEQSIPSSASDLLESIAYTEEDEIMEISE